MGKAPPGDAGALYRSGAYAAHNPDWHDADAPVKAAGLARWLTQYSEPPRKVLDIGCGTGGVLTALKARFDDRWPNTVWEGWDIAEEAIRRARPAERLRFVCGDALASDVTADVGLVVDVIEHVVDDERFLAEVARRVRWCLLRIPLDLSAWDVLRPGRLVGVRERYGHRHVYTRAMALDVVRRAGLEVVGTAYDRVPVRATTWRGRGMEALRRWLVRQEVHVGVRALGGCSLVVSARPTFS